MKRRFVSLVVVSVLPVLTACTYDVVVPIGGYRTSEEKTRCEFDSVKAMDSSRIAFVVGVMMRDAGTQRGRTQRGPRQVLVNEGF